MTNAPADLLGFRRAVMAETGLADPADVGIVGDGIHQRTGGYHEGRSVLAAIGRYHPGAAAGSSTEDYSARLARDRAGLTEDASAADIGASWPRGGRQAWLRFNRLLVAQLQAGDPALAAIRAINYSPDGTSRRRIDRQYGFANVQDSADSVDIHTHFEWYRDTAGQRQASLDRLVELIRAARDNTPLGDDMAISDADWAYVKRLVTNIERVATYACDPGKTTIPNLDYGYDGQGATHTVPNPTALLLNAVRSVQVGGVDLDALAARVAPLVVGQLGEKLDAYNAKLDKVLSALAAAGHIAES